MSEQPRVGAVLGRFRLDAPLGAGASGAVFRARDALLDTDVAVKVLTGTLVSADEAWQRFKQELLIARRLSHPGICRVFDIHDEGGWRFISMEYIAGKTLAGIVQARKTLEVPVAVAVARAMSRAVAVAHRVGVVHRDLKPANVIIGADERVVVLDFGIASALAAESMTRTGVLKGTPLYMAPELFAGARATPASDQYALGVVLYRCLAGQVPFPAANLYDMGKAAQQGEVASLREFDDDLPARLDDVVLRALSRAPTDRFPSVEDFETALAACCPNATLGLDLLQLGSLQLGDGAPDAHGTAEPATAATQVRGSPITVRARLRDLAPVGPARDDRRQLRAVLCCDVSASAASAARRAEVLRANVEPVLTDHCAVAIEAEGETLLAGFATPAAAVTAALEVQVAIDHANRAAADRGPVLIRLAVHGSAAMPREPRDLERLSDGARRLVELARASEILVTRPAWTELETLAIDTRFRSMEDLDDGGAVAVYTVLWDTRRAPTHLLRRVSGPNAKVSMPSTAAPATPDPGATASMVTAVSERTEVVEAPTPTDGTDLSEITVATRLPTLPGRPPTHPGVVIAIAAAATVVLASGTAWLMLRLARARAPVVATVLADPPVRGPAAGPSAALAPALPQTPQPAPPPEPPAAAAPAAEADEPPDPPPETVPAPPPPGIDPGRVAARLRGVAAVMRDRGLIEGDDAALDSQRRKAQKLLAQGRVSEAAVLAERAMAGASGRSINAEFVAAKLTRFNERLDRARSKGVERAVEPVMSKVLELLGNRKAAEANAQLNRAFALLETRR